MSQILTTIWNRTRYIWLTLSNCTTLQYDKTVLHTRNQMKDQRESITICVLNAGSVGSCVQCECVLPASNVLFGQILKGFLVAGCWISHDLRQHARSIGCFTDQLLCSRYVQLGQITHFRQGPTYIFAWAGMCLCSTHDHGIQHWAIVQLAVVDQGLCALQSTFDCAKAQSGSAFDTVR